MELTFNSSLPGKFFAFLSFADFFQNQLFSKNSFRNTIWVSNRLGPDQARHFVGPDMGPNYLQKLSADNTRRQRIKHKVFKYRIYIQVL